MSNKSYQMPGPNGIKITPTYQDGRLCIEVTNREGIRRVFTLPGKDGPCKDQ
jgi:hypothetical protein